MNSIEMSRLIKKADHAAFGARAIVTDQDVIQFLNSHLLDQRPPAVLFLVASCGEKNVA
jgi:hypothetical protein